jgi:hypothetical protein
MPSSFKITIQPCDPTATSSNSSNLETGNLKPADSISPTITILKPSANQIIGIRRYIGLINNGVDTASVETALDALI